MVWKASKNGVFSMRSFRDALEVKGEMTFPSKIEWGSWTPTKLSGYCLPQVERVNQVGKGPLWGRSIGRYTVGKITPVPMREVRSSDFGDRARIRMYFPRKGSQFTPPHYSIDFYWKDYCPMVFSAYKYDPAITPFLKLSHKTRANSFGIALAQAAVWHNFHSLGSRGMADHHFLHYLVALFMWQRLWNAGIEVDTLNFDGYCLGEAEKVGIYGAY
ncbi:Phosphatidylinositol 4-phosphate 5-kinase 1 [Vitis vinifera]|uniref:Phosphatidylinositol 4-phosphate 5-kinase 1 n=1 Tax=Vitis vinifera TaxID=29760 RepID=A0A438J6B1_VITVI|nr:Phosphatidylinositol 4-phosphate 5-kinase 1 [Vitis vinifera]